MSTKRTDPQANRMDEFERRLLLWEKHVTFSKPIEAFRAAPRSSSSAHRICDKTGEDSANRNFSHFGTYA